MKGYDNIPALAEFYPEVKRYFPLQQWLGFAVPKDTPPAAVAVLGQNFEKAMKDPGLQKWLAENQMESMGIWGDAGRQVLRTSRGKSFVALVRDGGREGQPVDTRHRQAGVDALTDHTGHAVSKQ